MAIDGTSNASQSGEGVSESGAQEMLDKLESIRNLPTLPLVIERLGEAIRDPSSAARRVANIIEDDPVIMARVLKVVNSAYYSASEPITNVQRAVARLGMVTLRNIALATSVFPAFGAGGEDGENRFDRHEFWRHSICTGIAAAVLNDRAKSRLFSHHTRDALHLAGLLHDIGKIVYDQYFSEKFHEAVRVSFGERIPLFVAERRVMGLDHAEAGVWLAVKWKLGPELVQVIHSHHDLNKANDKWQELLSLVNVANYICNTERLGSGGDTAPVFTDEAWKRLGITVSDIPEIVAAVQAESQRSEILMAMN